MNERKQDYDEYVAELEKAALAQPVLSVSQKTEIDRIIESSFALLLWGRKILPSDTSIMEKLKTEIAAVIEGKQE